MRLGNVEDDQIGLLASTLTRSRNIRCNAFHIICVEFIPDLFLAHISEVKQILASTATTLHHSNIEIIKSAVYTSQKVYRRQQRLLLITQNLERRNEASLSVALGSELREKIK